MNIRRSREVGVEYKIVHQGYDWQFCTSGDKGFFNFGFDSFLFTDEWTYWRGWAMFMRKNTWVADVACLENLFNLSDHFNCVSVGLHQVSSHTHGGDLRKLILRLGIGQYHDR